MKPGLLMLLALSLSFQYTFSQDSIPFPVTHVNKAEQRYKFLKDSLSKFRLVPAVSMILIKKTEVEINLFNSILSATEYRDDLGTLKKLNARTTYMYNIMQVSYGVSQKLRVNIGFDVNLISGRIDHDPTTSIFKVFNSHTKLPSKYASAISSVAPRVRWQPFKRNMNFVIQSSFIIPAVSNDEKKDVLGQNQVSFSAQFLYSQSLSKHFFLFGQLSLQYGFSTSRIYSATYTPLAIYLSYVPTKRMVLFALVNYIPVFQKNTNWRYQSYALAAGGGLQYSISRSFLINSFYTNIFEGKNYGNYTGFNLGARLLIK